MKLDDVLFEEDKLHPGKNITQQPVASTDKWKILIVDDEKDVHEVTDMILGPLIFDGRGVEFLNAYSARQAKEILSTHDEVAVIILDVVMEDDNAGLNLVQFIRNELKDTMVRIIIRTGHPGQAPEEIVTLEYDINDYWQKTELTAQNLRTAVIIALRSYRDLSTIAKLNVEIESTQKELIYTLGEIAESRSTETGCHVRRVGEITELLVRKYGLPEKQANLLKLAASMHDLGKLAIHDSILNKPGRLTPEEFEIMKTHTLIGYEILRHSNRELLKMATIIAKEHHENYDGTGYPCGLRGEDIHIFSRIVALVDVFDALGNKRVYKDAWPKDEILDYIQSEKGKKFDPYLVDLFIKNIDEILLIRDMFPDRERSLN